MEMREAYAIELIDVRTIWATGDLTGSDVQFGWLHPAYILYESDLRKLGINTADEVHIYSGELEERHADKLYAKIDGPGMLTFRTCTGDDPGFDYTYYGRFLVHWEQAPCPNTETA